MDQQLLHHVLAKYYDNIYCFRDYLDESVRLQNIIEKYLKTGGNSVLDVACGTGLNLKYLKDDFSCTGVDISEAMLKLARKNVEGVKFKESDMKVLKLGKQFDVVMCLFSSIGYVKTLSNLERTIQGFSRHLKPGGLALIEPSYAESAYLRGEPRVATYDGAELKIARVTYARLRQALAVVNMHILIAKKGVEPKYFVDRHDLGVFSVDETLRIMGAAGLKSKFLKGGLMPKRELFIGIKK